MNIISKPYHRLQFFFWKQNRMRFCRQQAQRLKNPSISIISMNCIGGVLYHDLGLGFKSPTINLYFQAGDFIRFCENLEYYLSIDHMEKCNDPAIISKINYPVAYLGDIKLFLVHYPSVEEAQRKWNDRKKRIEWDRIVLMATDRDGMTEDLKERFEQLPYPKVMFVHRPDMNHPNCFYIHGWEDAESVGILTEPIAWRGKRTIDQFDYISFFNEV